MWQEGEDIEKLKRKAHIICKEFLAGKWEALPFNDFCFTQVSGGLSNRLYLCSLPKGRNSKEDETPNEVLLRVYGPEKEKESDRFMESILQDVIVYALLAEKGLGPKLYGVFGDGRLEEFIPSITLSSDNMRNMCLSTAREMARIHSLSVPIRKDPHTLKRIAERWLDYFENNLTVHEEKLGPELLQLFSRKKIRQEMEWLSDLMQKTKSPVVFCHNDLQGGNILLCNDVKNKCEGSRVIFIDFEFAFYNYRTFDIANHFCEWCFDYNTKDPPHFEYHPNKFPSESEQSSFIEAYLEQLQHEGAVRKDFSMEEEKQKILKEVKIFSLFAHLCWVLWSFRMFVRTMNDFTFDYKAHGECRLKAYRKLKQELVETCNNV